MNRLTLLIFVVFFFPFTQAKAQEKGAAAFELPATDEGLPGAGVIRRYDWFKQLWSERRATWATQVEKDTGAIVFLGDSIIQGWGDNLGGAFDSAKVANRGISGDTTRGMLLRLNEDVLKLKPACVVMLMGTNDLEEAVAPQVIADNVKLIVAELKKHNAKLPIVLCQVFPSSEQQRRPTEKIKEINALCAAAVKGDSQVTVLDTWTLFADEKGDAKPSEFPDLLHPNEAGYLKWAAALRPIFATLGFIETEADDFEPEQGFVSLFNGRDLTGWCYLPTTPEMREQAEKWKSRDKGAPPWPIIDNRVDLAGKTDSPDGRYVAKNGRLIVTTPADGRRIQQMWTTQEFPEDFVLKLEFRATPNADSGVFLRKPQLQCRDFPLAGPYKDLKNYKSGDWNELVVVAQGGVAKCTCNGEVIEEAFKLPETGPIGLEGDRGQLEYRRIRIRHGKNLLSAIDSKYWRFETAEGGEGSLNIEDGAAVFRTTKTTGTTWHVQAYQAGLDLEEGAEYILRFKMKSPELCTVGVLGLVHQEPWSTIGLYEEILPRHEFRDFEISFVAQGVVKDKNRVGFLLGFDKGSVAVKDVTLEKK